MWIGAARIILDFYNNDQAKVKRRQLEELSKDLRKSFNLSAMEVEDFDDPERCVLGWSAVMPAHWKEHQCHDFIEKVCLEIDQTSFARVTTVMKELYRLE